MTLEEQIDKKALEIAKRAKDHLAGYPAVVKLLGDTLKVGDDASKVEFCAFGENKYPWTLYTNTFHTREGIKGLKFLEKNLQDQSQIPLLLAKGWRELGLYSSRDLLAILEYALNTGFKA